MRSATLPAQAGHPWLGRAAPAAFVLIWSTGFVVARFAMPHAQPLTFLSLRYALSIAAFGLWIAVARPPWPRGRVQWQHLAVTGVLMQAGYLGGVWCAVKQGLGAGLAALIVGLQPVLTALWVSRSGRGRGGVAARQWAGLGLGLAGLLLVVENKLHLGQASPANVGLALLALVSITAGTLYQKRYVAPCDVRTANTVQLLAALAVTLPLALLEPRQFDLQPGLVGALAWSVLVLTLGGSSLLYLLIQRGAATGVTSLMYLVPPCAALLAWWLFDEALTPLVLAGLALTALGVALVLRERAPVAPTPT
ncbi:MAG: DMT family transporter [Burkholderiales bacterium]|nr:DMT family transporter [Burkholderiales bacterium]